MSNPDSHNQDIISMVNDLTAIEHASTRLGIKEVVAARLLVAQTLYSGAEESVEYNASRWSGILSVGAEAAKRAMEAVPPNPVILLTELDNYVAAHPNHHHDEVMSGK